METVFGNLRDFLFLPGSGASPDMLKRLMRLKEVGAIEQFQSVSQVVGEQK